MENNNIGTCKFCMQTKMIANFEGTQEELDEQATLECKCKEGIEYRSFQKDIEKANGYIDHNFTEYSEDTRETLKRITYAVKKQDVEKLAVTLDGRTSVSIEIKDGSLAIKKKIIVVVPLGAS